MCQGKSKKEINFCGKHVNRHKKLTERASGGCPMKSTELEDCGLNTEITPAILSQSISYHHPNSNYTRILNPKHSSDSKFHVHNSCKVLNACLGTLANKDNKLLIFLKTKAQSSLWVTRVSFCPLTAAWTRSQPRGSKHITRCSCVCPPLDRNQDVEGLGSDPVASPWSPRTLLS